MGIPYQVPNLPAHMGLDSVKLLNQYHGIITVQFGASLFFETNTVINKSQMKRSKLLTKSYHSLDMQKLTPPV